jgi:hypothetical protein
MTSLSVSLGSGPFTPETAGVGDRRGAAAATGPGGALACWKAVPGGGFERPNPFIAGGPDPNALIQS